MFHGAADTFDPRRHRVRTNLTAGAALRKATAAIKTQKVQTAEPAPFILEVRDALSNSVNEQITPGGVLQIRGGRLKLAAENPENGIFLIDADGNAAKLQIVIENKPSRLIAMLPADIAPGTYELEVRTTFANSARESRNMKIRRFNRELVTVCDE